VRDEIEQRREDERRELEPGHGGDRPSDGAVVGDLRDREREDADDDGTDRTI
jgi:hypothetical protein